MIPQLLSFGNEPIIHHPPHDADRNLWVAEPNGNPTSTGFLFSFFTRNETRLDRFLMSEAFCEAIHEARATCHWARCYS
jgi:hypothetical protein